MVSVEAPSETGLGRGALLATGHMLVSTDARLLPGRGSASSGDPPGSPHHPASAAWSWGEGRLGGGRESAVQLGGAGICGHLVGWDLQPLFPVPGGPSWPPWDPVRRPRHEELRVDTERTGHGRLPCGFSSPVWGNGKLVFDWNLLRGPAEAGAGGQRRHLIAAASPLTLVLQQKKEERKEKNIKKSQYFN